MMANMRSDLRYRRIFSSGAFFVWAVLAFIAGTSLMATHLYALPKPGLADATLERAINALRSDTDQKQWLAVHVLYAQCRCSRRILDHLATSARPQKAHEKILLVGSLDELDERLGQIAARGFEIVKTTPEALRKRFHVQAAPLLLVVAPGGTVRYAGGYTERKQGLRIRDTGIIDEVASNQHPTELPLFGCAVSKQLQQLLDPLGLRASPDRWNGQSP
jgi:hypothetical protein